MIKEIDKKATTDEEKGEYDPYKNRSVEHPTSNLDTMTHILRNHIGSGILAMPKAFLNGGLIIGTFGTIIVASICVYTMNMLVNSANIICQRSKKPSLRFGEVAEISFKEGPPILRNLSPYIGKIISVFLCVDQLGTCSVYYIFIASNLKIVLHSWFSFDLGLKTYMVILLIPIVLLCWIRSLQLLAKFEFLANLVMGVGIGIIVYYSVTDIPPIEDRISYFSSLKQIPLWFGTTIFAFEGAGFVLPLENKMKRPQAFGGCFGVLARSMLIVGTIYIGVGLLGYIRFGADTQSSITLNLPKDPLAETVRLTTAISIFFSYALVFYVPIDTIMPQIRKYVTSKNYAIWSELMLRSLLVFLTLGIAEVVPNLEILISFIGSVVSAANGLIFTPLIDIATNYENYGHLHWILWKDLLIFTFGCVGFATGIYISIDQALDQALESKYPTS